MAIRNMTCPDCDGQTFRIYFDPDAVANAERSVAEGKMTPECLMLMSVALRGYWVECTTAGCSFATDAASVETDLLAP